MKRLLAAVALLTSLFAVAVQAQTTTTVYGLIKDLAQNPVTTGKITFTLRPSTDVTESGLARFTTQTITCPIASTGNVVGLANSNVTTTTGTTNPGTSVTVSSPTGFAIGQPLLIAGAGTLGAPYVGTISNIAGSVFTISPATTTSVSAGALVYTACQITMNTALQPPNSGYLVKFWPQNINTATIFMYALNSLVDVTTVVSTQAQLPSVGGTSASNLPQTCTNGQTTQWNGSAWVCASITNLSGTQLTSATPPGFPSFTNFCPAGVNSTSIFQRLDTTYASFQGVDETTTPGGLAAGTPTFCHRTYFNDTSVPVFVKNALVSIYHTWGAGTTTSTAADDRALGIRIETLGSISGNFPNSRIQGVYGEVGIKGAPTGFGSGPDQGQDGLRFVIDDQHNSTLTTQSKGVTGTYTQAAATAVYSGCQVCGIGLLGQVSINAAANNNSVFFAAVSSSLGNGGSATNTNGINFDAPYSISGNFQNQWGFWGHGAFRSTDWIFLNDTLAPAFMGTAGLFTGAISTTGSNIPVSGSFTGAAALTTTQIAAQQVATVGNTGTPGAATYTYVICGKDGNAGASCGASRSTTTGNTSLNGSNYNNLQWSCINGVTSYDVYRTVAGGSGSSGTTGKIGNLAVAGTLNRGANTTCTFNDQGASGDGTTPPTQNTTGGVTVAGAVVPGAIGPFPNNRCQVGGINPTLESCADLQGGTSGLRSIVTESNTPEDITTSIWPVNESAEIKLGTGLQGSLCDTTHLLCWVSEVPMILNAGSSITGTGKITVPSSDLSAGTAWATGNNWKPPLGVPTIAPPVCNASGGSLSNGNYYWIARTANNLQTHSGQPKQAGPSMHTPEAIVNCAGGGAAQSIAFTSPSAVGNSPFQALDWQLALSTSPGLVEQIQANDTTNMSCTAGTVSTFNGVNYGCAMGATATVKAIQTGTRQFQHTDLSNVKWVIGAGAQVSFLTMLTGFTDFCGPINANDNTGGFVQGYNTPNWLIWNQSGEELSGINPLGFGIDGPCGGYASGTNATGGSAVPFSGGWMYEDTHSPNNLIEHVQGGGNGPTCTHNGNCQGTALTLTAAATASGGYTVYTGTITGGAANALAGFMYQVTGFTNAVNNSAGGQVFTAVGSTATTLTLINASGTAETHAGSAIPVTPFYPIFLDGEPDGTGVAAGVTGMITDITITPKSVGGVGPYTPSVIRAQGIRARVNFSGRVHLEMNNPTNGDGITCDDGAYCLFSGAVEGQNATVGTLAHLTATGGWMGGYGLCPIGTATSLQDRCKGLGQAAAAATFRDDTAAGQILKGFVGHFSSGIGFFKGVQFAEWPTLAALTAALPCSATTDGLTQVIQDAAAAPVYNANSTGGGSIHLSVFCNGSNWVNH